MVELIALIIFIISFVGAFFILFKKIPVLASLPKDYSSSFKKGKIFLKTEEKIKNFYNFFKKQIFLHKFLSWIKCLTLKIEIRVDSLLHKIRKKAQETEKKLEK